MSICRSVKNIAQIFHVLCGSNVATDESASLTGNTTTLLNEHCLDTKGCISVFRFAPYRVRIPLVWCIFKKARIRIKGI